VITRRPRFLPTAASLRGTVTQKTSPIPTTANDQGLTLIECLVAIIMVALVASAIAPVLVISVASRVQSQKAEQALKAAQSEIDQIRVLVERREATADDIPLPVPNFNEGNDSIADVAGPQYGALVAADAWPTVTQTRPIDVNRDGQDDFAVQIFRSPGGADIGGVPIAFVLGVRVYDFDAVNSDRTGNLLIEPASLGLTGGEGERRERPLAALYTTVSVGDTSESLCEYINYYNARNDLEFELPQGCTDAPEIDAQ
jgi:prepilin-type N-terminal cleavage/methylation domain-containing protein